jgi:hypothetical protein
MSYRFFKFKGLSLSMNNSPINSYSGGGRGRNRMIIGFATTYANSAYHD